MNNWDSYTDNIMSVHVTTVKVIHSILLHVLYMYYSHLMKCWSFSFHLHFEYKMNVN